MARAEPLSVHCPFATGAARVRLRQEFPFGVIMRLTLLMMLIPLICASAAPAQDMRAQDDQARLLGESLEQAAGMRGAYDSAAKVFRISVPRDDVKLEIDGAAFRAFMGLTSWASIKPGAHGRSIVMGDFVLKRDEIDPAIDAALAGGLCVTALHNRFLTDGPRVFFMHIEGEGKAGQLAAGVGKIFAGVKQVRAKAPAPAKRSGHLALPAVSSIHAGKIDAILKAKGESRDGMYKLVVGAKVTMPCACEIGAEMGVTNSAALYGTDQGAMLDGDFACTAAQLQPVLRALRQYGIGITAIHNELVDETPRLTFVHCCGAGAAPDLARAVKAALDVQSHAALAQEPLK
jgi:hypothetical protein